MQKPLQNVMQFITGHPRQYIERGRDFEWSNASWTHNVFRLYELIFGRRYGENGVGDTIRAEMSVGMNEYGEVVYACHSVEASFALAEQYIREYLSSWKRLPFRIYIPVLQTPQGIPVFASPYLFAIAFDNSSGETTSVAFTITGSNMILVTAARALSGDDLSGVTYNSVSLTLGKKQTMLARTQYLHYLKAPATGSNTLAFSGTDTAGRGASYSGALQTGGVDSASVYETASGDRTITISVTTTNSWIVESYGSYDADPTAQIVCTSGRPAFTEGSQISDTNAGVSSGNNAPGYTWGVSDRHAILAIAFAPVASAGGTVKRVMNLPLLGVG